MYRNGTVRFIYSMNLILTSNRSISRDSPSTRIAHLDHRHRDLLPGGARRHARGTHMAPEAGTEQNQVQVGKGLIQGNPESDVRGCDLTGKEDAMRFTYSKYANFADRGCSLRRNPRIIADTAPSPV